jgi:hypothetical protein
MEQVLIPLNLRRVLSDNIRYPLYVVFVGSQATTLPPLLEAFMAPHHLYLIDGQFLSGCPGHYSLHFGYYGDSVAVQDEVLVPSPG